MAWQAFFDRGGISRLYQQTPHITDMNGLGLIVYPAERNTKVGSGSKNDLRHGLAVRLECDGKPTFNPEGLFSGGKPTFSPERRQCGGFRPFKRSGLNSRFVPEGDIAGQWVLARCG